MSFNFINTGLDDQILKSLNAETPDEDLQKAMNKQGLVQKEIQVKGKNGQVFTRKQWVKAGEDQKSGQSGKDTNDEQIPHKITGKNMDDLVENLKQKGFELDSADRHSPQDSVTLYKDKKEYTATFNKYNDGGVEVIGIKPSSTSSKATEDQPNNTENSPAKDKGKFNHMTGTYDKPKSTMIEDYFSGNHSHDDGKKAVIDLLGKGYTRSDLMEQAKKSGITWKESDHEGINWMRASMAIQKHMVSGTTNSSKNSVEPKSSTDKQQSDKNSGSNSQQSSSKAEKAMEKFDETEKLWSTLTKATDEPSRYQDEKVMSTSGSVASAMFMHDVADVNDVAGTNKRLKKLADSMGITDNGGSLIMDNQGRVMATDKNGVSKKVYVSKPDGTGFISSPQKEGTFFSTRGVSFEYSDFKKLRDASMAIQKHLENKSFVPQDSDKKHYNNYSREEKRAIGHKVEAETRAAIRKVLKYKVGQEVKTLEFLDKAKDVISILPNNSEISLDTRLRAYNTIQDHVKKRHKNPEVPPEYYKYTYIKDYNGNLSVTIETWSYNPPEETLKSSKSVEFNNVDDMIKHLQDSRKSNGEFTDGLIHSTGSELDLFDKSNGLYGYTCRLWNYPSSYTCTPIDRYWNS